MGMGSLCCQALGSTSSEVKFPSNGTSRRLATSWRLGQSHAPGAPHGSSASSAAWAAGAGGHAQWPQAGGRGGPFPQGPTFVFCAAPLWSHRPAVLDAALGGNAGPGQEAAEQALGLPVYPLGDGARAQAGQRRADVLQVVSGHRLRTVTLTV